MSDKSSPGPWQQQPGGLVFAGKRCVCVVGDPNKRMDGVDKANARRIAAVPEMEAACEAILAGWGHQDGVSRAVELAREALAKVRG